MKYEVTSKGENLYGQWFDNRATNSKTDMPTVFIKRGGGKHTDKCIRVRN